MSDVQRPKRRTWIGEWVRSEAFWRDVASRAISGLIVAAALGTLAVILGLIDKRELVGSVIAIGGEIGGFVLGFWVAVKLIGRIRSRDPLRSILLHVVAILTVISVVIGVTLLSLKLAIFVFQGPT